MASSDPESGRKHRRSLAEDGAEEVPNRRKHHRHHHSHGHRHNHHHRHRHHHRSSKHSSADDLPPPPPPPPRLPFVPRLPVTEDDREEGEILEDEEEEVHGRRRELAARVPESDIESGEIKPDDAVDDASDLYALEAVCCVDRDEVNGGGGNTSFELVEELNHNLLENNELSPNPDIGAGEGALRQPDEALNGKVARDDVYETSRSHWRRKKSRDYYTNVEDDMEEDESLALKTYSAKRAEKDLMSPADNAVTAANGTSGHKKSKGDQAQMGSVSPSLGSREESRYSDVDSSDLKRRRRSCSLAVGENLNLKDRRRNHHKNKRDWSTDMGGCPDLISERFESKRCLESRESRISSVNKKRSISPQISKEKYDLVEHLPSCDYYHDDALYRKRSRSRDHAKERRSQSRNGKRERSLPALHSHERESKCHRNDGDRTKRSCSRDHLKYDSDSERALRQDKENCYDKRDRSDMEKAIHRESERSHSYNRHGGREDRHGSRDVDRYMDKHRDRECYGERERERERVRESERDRLRDMEREKDRARDREKYRDRDRDRGDDRVNRHQKYFAEDGSDGRERYSDSRHPKYDEMDRQRDKVKVRESKRCPSSSRHSVEKEKETRDDEEEEEGFEERVMMKLEKQEEDDIDRIKEESRKRRQAILEKYKPQESESKAEPHSEDSGKEGKTPLLVEQAEEHSSSLKAATDSLNQVFPDVIENKHGVSDLDAADASFTIGRSPLQNGTSATQMSPVVGGLGDGSPKSERSTDIFCDDIFGETPAGVRKPGKGDGLQVERSGLHDNWDDAEGYYIYRFGEVLDGRYEITAAHGKGVFSIVVRARDLKASKGDPEEVAIKIIRNNETMYKAGQDELVILNKLAGADPEDKRHCVRFLSSFKYRNHLCLVFESLHMNLREVLKKFGRNIGLKLTAVRAYAKQLFIALKHLRNCGVLHCDIKPDNMLVNEAKNVLKLCDFGNAMLTGRNDITPYLVSRFYRAPEIILGLPYDHPLDIWSVGCCLYELYSGKVLFPGPTNNDMLRLNMELKGPFPKKMLKKGAFTAQHFDQDFNFHATEEDPVTKKTVKRLILNVKPKDIGSLITGFPGEDPKMLTNFRDLLERIFVLDPEKRMTVSQALSHPFFTGK